MKKILTLLFLVLTLVLSSAFAVTAVFAEEGEGTEQEQEKLFAEQTQVTDWIVGGNAYYVESSDQFVLTDNVGYVAGSIWYNLACRENFVVEFDYYTGGRDRPLKGADGLALAFYSNYGFTGATGGGLGFNGTWGVELDTYYNSGTGDASYNHISVIKDRVSNHLAYGNIDNYSEDYKWHNLKVVVVDGTLWAYVDNNLMIKYDGVTPTGNGWVGITAATGTGTNEHIVKNIKIGGADFDERYVGANLEYEDVTDTYEGELIGRQRVINVTGTVNNNAYATANNTQVTLTLPEGVAFVDGETATKSAGNIVAGSTSTVTWQVIATLGENDCKKEFPLDISLFINGTARLGDNDVMPVVLHKGEQEWTATEHKHAKAYNCCGVVVVAEENHEWENGVCSECGYVCAHLGGHITCTEKAICEECGLYYGEEPIGHVFEGEWASHEDYNHAKYCFCGEPLVEECEFVIGKENSFCRVCGNDKPLNDYGCDCMATMGANPMHAMGIGLLALASIVFKFRKK